MTSEKQEQKGYCKMKYLTAFSEMSEHRYSHHQIKLQDKKQER